MTRYQLRKLTVFEIWDEHVRRVVCRLTGEEQGEAAQAIVDKANERLVTLEPGNSGGA